MVCTPLGHPERCLKHSHVGGIDAVIAELLSSHSCGIEREVRAAISDQFGGEQPVGTCIILPAPTLADLIAYCPTMRSPMDVQGTNNAYLAFRALMFECRRHRPRIGTVICSGFCTGVGAMPGPVAAAQMRMAWDAVFHGPSVPRPDWTHIISTHRRLDLTHRLRA